MRRGGGGGWAQELPGREKGSDLEHCLKVPHQSITVSWAAANVARDKDTGRGKKSLSGIWAGS